MMPTYECAMDHGNGFATAADEFEPVGGVSAAQAATRFAERYDQDGADYPILNRGHAHVIVIDIDGKRMWRVSIFADSKPVYHASSLEERASPSTPAKKDSADG